MLSTLVLSNENRLFAFVRKEAPHLFRRGRMSPRRGNYFLNQTAKNCGVKKFDKFHNAGYRGLYNGETADDIAKRKN